MTRDYNRLTGIRCPLCGSKTMCIRTDLHPGRLKRRRQCEKCGGRFTTEEIIRPESIAPHHHEEDSLRILLDKLPVCLLPENGNCHTFLQARLESAEGVEESTYREEKFRRWIRQICRN